jgi:hypothetical protein
MGMIKRPKKLATVTTYKTTTGKNGQPQLTGGQKIRYTKRV